MSCGSIRSEDRKPGFFNDFLTAVLNMSAFSVSMHPDAHKELLGVSDDPTTPDKSDAPGN